MKTIYTVHFEVEAIDVLKHNKIKLPSEVKQKRLLLLIADFLDRNFTSCIREPLEMLDKPLLHFNEVIDQILVHFLY